MAAERMGIVFYSVQKIFEMVAAITEAVQTVRQNKKECEDIARCVASVSTVLTRLHQSTPMAADPAMGGALGELAASLGRALELVRKCQRSSKVRRYVGAGDMAKELRRVQDDIDRKVTLASFAANVQTNVTLNNMQYASPPPSPLWTTPMSYNVVPSWSMPSPPVLAPQLAPWPPQTNQWSASHQVASCQKPPSMAELCFGHLQNVTYSVLQGGVLYGVVWKQAANIAQLPRNGCWREEVLETTIMEILVRMGSFLFVVDL
ncbi:hypothetical protein EJB05_26011, partial [Eragrostis curvula]